MKVLVWGINYAPELTGIAPCNVALCEHLLRQGHQVEMVTGFPYYPHWQKRAEDCGRLYHTETLNGVVVCRCWQFVPRSLSAFKRILHEASFVLTSTLRVLFGARSDLMVVVSPPLLLGTAAAIVHGLRGIPFVFHVQDLQPDAAVGLGMLKPGLLTRALYRLEAIAYRSAARVSGISGSMLQAFQKKGVPAAKQLYFPNSVRVSSRNGSPPQGVFRRRHGIADDDLLVVYSGNLGVKQGLGIILDAAQLCEDPRVQFIICGDGAARPALSKLAQESGLKNLRLLPLQAPAAFEEMMVDADLSLITQQAGSGKFFLPSKLLTSLVFRKPIVAVADPDSELALAIREGDFGICLSPERPNELANQLDQWVDAGPRLEEMARKGRIYVERFDAERVLGAFEAELKKLLILKSAPRGRGTDAETVPVPETSPPE